MQSTSRTYVHSTVARPGGQLRLAGTFAEKDGSLCLAQAGGTVPFSRTHRTVRFCAEVALAVRIGTVPVSSYETCGAGRPESKMPRLARYRARCASFTIPRQGDQESDGPEWPIAARQDRPIAAPARWGPLTSLSSGYRIVLWSKVMRKSKSIARWRWVMSTGKSSGLLVPLEAGFYR